MTSPACPICLDNISATNLLTTNCRHVFHFACLRQWARETMRDKRRFFPIGFMSMDEIPVHECPLCRKPVTRYHYQKQWHSLIYDYNHNPYRLQSGTLVYYYYQLRQPGTARSGFLGFVEDVTNPVMRIRCIWNGGRSFLSTKVYHTVAYYCVFDVFFLALPNGGIPTRSQINLFFVAEHMGQGFITEEYNILQQLPLQEMTQVLRNYVEHSASKISPLVPETVYRDTPMHFFVTVYLQSALSSLRNHHHQLPSPVHDYNFSSQEYQRLVVNQAIGLNQIRLILAYHRMGLPLPDDTDAPRVHEILSITSSRHL